MSAQTSRTESTPGERLEVLARLVDGLRVRGEPQILAALRFHLEDHLLTVEDAGEPGPVLLVAREFLVAVAAADESADGVVRWLAAIAENAPDTASGLLLVSTQPAHRWAGGMYARRTGGIGRALRAKVAIVETRPS